MDFDNCIASRRRAIKLVYTPTDHSRCVVRRFDQVFVIPFNDKDDCIARIQDVLINYSPLFYGPVVERRTLHVSYSQDPTTGKNEDYQATTGRSNYPDERGNRNIPISAKTITTQMIKFVNGTCAVPRNIEEIGFEATHEKDLGWGRIVPHNVNAAGGGTGSTGGDGSVLMFSEIQCDVLRVRHDEDTNNPPAADGLSQRGMHLNPHLRKESTRMFYPTEAEGRKKQKTEAEGRKKQKAYHHKTVATGRKEHTTKTNGRKSEYPSGSMVSKTAPQPKKGKNVTPARTKKAVDGSKGAKKNYGTHLRTHCKKSPGGTNWVYTDTKPRPFNSKRMTRKNKNPETPWCYK